MFQRFMYRLTFIEKYFKSTTRPTIVASDITLSVTETFQWIFSGLNVNVSQSRLDSIRIKVQPGQPNQLEHVVENLQITIHNSSFNSLDLKPGTKAEITECNIDAQFKPRPTLITANNSDVSIQNSHFRNFINENDSTILFGHSNSQIVIENSIFNKHNSSKGVLLLQNNCSLGISDSLILENVVFTSTYSAVTLRDRIHAVVHNSLFRNNSALVGGALCAEEHCRVTLTNCTFSSNKAITGKTLNISENSILQKVLDRNKTGPSKPVNSSLFNQTSSYAIKSKTIPDYLAQPGRRSLISRIKPSHLVNRLYSMKEHSAQPEGFDPGIGGALFVAEQSQLLVRNCLFKDNSAQFAAGAITTGLNATLDIQGTTFVRNKASQGGAINVGQQAQLRITNCVFDENVSQGPGGAIAGGYSVTLVIQETTFVGNKAFDDGGAIEVLHQVQLRITNCVFDENVCQRVGGAIVGGGYATLDIQETTFVGNKALQQSGAIDVGPQGHLRITNCVFDDNESQQGIGGAIGGGPNVTLVVQETNFTRNSAEAGGAIFASANATLDTQETTFVGNKALQDGGAINVQHQAQLRITNCVFDENVSQRIGGAICSIDNVTLVVKETNFTRNSAIQGGAIDVQHQTKLSLTNCRLEHNSASSTVGGAINARTKTTLTIRETIFTGNSAPNGGALIVLYQSNGHVEWCVFHNNTAKTTGGAVHVDSKSSLQIENTNFTTNNSTDGGAISIEGNSQLQTNSCSFWENVAKQDGGAINLNGESTAEIEHCYFLSNQANSGQGGAININNPEHLSVKGTLLLGNVASNYGGALVISGGNNVTMNNIMCIGNRAQQGGCLCIDSVTLTLNNSDISENSAQSAGAGVFASYSKIQVRYLLCPTNVSYCKYCRINYIKKKNEYFSQ